MRDFSAGTTCSPMIYQALRQKAAVAVRAMWGSGECVFLRTRPWGCDTPGKNAEVFHLCDLEPEVGKLYNDGCSAQAKAVADGAQPCTADPAASTGVDGHLQKKRRYRGGRCSAGTWFRESLLPQPPAGGGQKGGQMMPPNQGAAYTRRDCAHPKTA